jgi:hypothetical protein
LLLPGRHAIFTLRTRNRGGAARIRSLILFATLVELVAVHAVAERVSSSN